MKDACREQPGRSGDGALNEMLDAPNATRRDDRQANRVADGAKEVEVEASAGPVAIHAGHQDLAGARGFHPSTPGDRVQSRRSPAAMRYDDPAAPLLGRSRPDVDGDDHALASELPGGFLDQSGARDRSGVNAAFVGAREQQPPDIVERPNPSADGQRQKDAGRGARDDVNNRIAVLMARRDVEKTQLVGSSRVIKARLLDRIARIAQRDEVDAFDDAAVLHIETGDDPEFQHVSPSSDIDA